MGRGKAAVKFDAAAGWLTFIHGDLLCLFNFAVAAQRVRMPSGEWELVLRSDSRETEAAREVPGQAVFIYRRQG
jgi:hypothetical protein